MQDKLLATIAQEYRIDIDKLEDFIYTRFPEMKNTEKCANCGASMNQYIHSVDCIDALLVYGMAKIIREKIKKGFDFTTANAVHVQDTLGTYYSVASRTSWCAKLGLIAKVKNEDGKHDTAKGWLITKRGWDFLRGEAIPGKVQTFRKQITCRFDDMITIDQAFSKHVDTVKTAQAKKKIPKSDYTEEINTYNKSDWFEYGPVVEGKLV